MEIKRFVMKIDGATGEVETIRLEGLTKEEQSQLLHEVFEQGLLRLGYQVVGEKAL